MKQLSHLLAVIGKQAAKQAVCATSPKYCYQPEEPKSAREKYQKQLLKNHNITCILIISRKGECKYEKQTIINCFANSIYCTCK